VPSRWRRGHRKLAARGAGERGGWIGRGGATARARAHQRSRDRRGASRGLRLSRSDRDRPPPWHSPPDARGGGARLKTLLVGARQIVTCRGPARARRGRELADLDLWQDAAWLVEGERIGWAGSRSEARSLPSTLRFQH